MPDGNRLGEAHLASINSDLIEEAKEYREHAKEDPDRVVSELPRLIELLESTGFESDDVALRGVILFTIHKIAAHNPDALSDHYPAVLESTLDMTESRVVARKLLHETIELVARDVPIQTIVDKLTSVNIVGTIEDIKSELDIEDQLPANGAMAMELSQQIRDSAVAIGGRGQLVAEACAEAFDELVAYRAAQQGFDPIDGLVDLRSQYERDNGPFTLGFSAPGTIENMIENGETQSYLYVLRYAADAIAAVQLILSVEETVERILRAEAVVAGQI